MTGFKWDLTEVKGSLVCIVNVEREMVEWVLEPGLEHPLKSKKRRGRSGVGQDSAATATTISSPNSLHCEVLCEKSKSPDQTAGKPSANDSLPLISDPYFATTVCASVRLLVIYCM